MEVNDLFSEYRTKILTVPDLSIAFLWTIQLDHAQNL